jgi:hypothetical protein
VTPWGWSRPLQQQQMPLYRVTPSQARVRRLPIQASVREAFPFTEASWTPQPHYCQLPNPRAHVAHSFEPLLRRPSHLTTSTDDLQAPGESTPASRALRASWGFISTIPRTREALRSTVRLLPSPRSGTAPSLPIPNESSWLTVDTQADRLRRHRTVCVIALLVLWTTLK